MDENNLHVQLKLVMIKGIVRYLNNKKYMLVSSKWQGSLSLNLSCNPMRLLLADEKKKPANEIRKEFHSMTWSMLLSEADLT